MQIRFPHAALAPLLALVLGSPAAQAIDLVAYTFGSGVGTASAQTLAAHLVATDVVGHKGDGSVAPHSFIDLGGGNMAMQLLKSEGGYWFDFTLSAQPGYRFQISNAHFAFRTRDTAGVNRDISVVPNGEAGVLWYDASGGDTIFTDMGPGGFGWKTASWNAFVLRDDLQTLHVRLSLHGNSPNSKAIFDGVRIEGEVLAVPEPNAALLMGAGLLGLAALRRRRHA